MSVTLTGFADEISTDLDEQLDVLATEGISHLELRGVWGKWILTLTDEEIALLKEKLNERHFKISCIGSPIGKIKISEDFNKHLADFKRAIQLAKYFRTPFIRVFSFFIPKEDDPAKHRDEVIYRMKELVRHAEEENVILLLENENHVYGDNGLRCLDILQACDSPHLRCAFDPANFIQCGVYPMTNAYPLLQPYLSYIHIKDALIETGKVVPAGEGDGEFKQLISALKQSQYSGFLSLEPHLKAADAFEGLSKPELFVVAVKALKKLLDQAEIEWN
jgi:sugar phosphate isomerase/epimerase